MVAPNATPTPHRVGPFDVSSTADELILRLEKQGELSLNGCLMFCSAMFSVTILGVVSIFQNNEKSQDGIGSGNTSVVFSPQINHFGFLWLFSSILLMFLLPIYVIHSYNSALIYSFQKSKDAFRRGRRKVARLRRIEYVSIRETRDPDKRYLYLMNIVYNDGQQLQIHNGYEEREVMNLANEISSFVGCPVKWKQGSAL